MTEGSRYSNGKIYKLVNDVDYKFYVGSTCCTLPVRLYKHKHYGKTHPDVRAFAHINSIGGWEHVQIILIELFPCNSKMELERRERYWIEKLKPELNCKIPARSQEEYRRVNRVELRKKKAIFRANNPEKLHLERKAYREKYADVLKEKRKERYICECGSSLLVICKAAHNRSQKHQSYVHVTTRELYNKECVRLGAIQI